MRITSAPRPPGIPPFLSAGPDRQVGARATLRAAAAPVGTLGWSAVLLVLAGICYNAVLGFLNARGLPVSMPIVALTEFAVLAVAGVFLLKSGLRPADQPAVLMFGFFLLSALAVSLMGGAPFPDMARNAAVIAIFLMIGLRAEERLVVRTVVIAALLVTAVLLLESLSVLSYAAVFEPGRYFEETRGISRFELDEIGLFANALGFDDRFSILNIVGHRTSSLFLEQVSLANFASVLLVFLVAFWSRLSIATRTFMAVLIIGILVTNNSRTLLALVLAAPLVYLLAPRLPRAVTLALMPAVLGGALLVSLTQPLSREDNLVGRLQLTIGTLRDLDLPAMLGAQAGEAAGFLDSGYTFVIYASSLLGMIVLWLFFSLIGAGKGADQKRASLMAGLYLFFNLMVSGTSIFSIKTAALLWFLIGYLRTEERQRQAAPAQRPA